MGPPPTFHDDKDHDNHFDDYNDNGDEDGIFSSRLRQLKQTVKKATEEALRTARHSQTAGAGELAERENDEPNASFYLGMELFGADPADLERRLQEDLNRMEKDVKKLFFNNNNVKQEEGENATAANQQQQRSTSTGAMEYEATKLRERIHFLRICSQARTSLDESITLSTAASSRFSSSDGPTLAQAALRWLDAHKFYQQAQEALSKPEARTTGSSSAAARHAASDILLGLSTSLRRQKVDVLAQARGCWQSSVELAPNTIVVRNATALADAYDALLAFQQGGGDSASGSADNSLSSALEDILKKFVKTIHEQFLKPEIDRHRIGLPCIQWEFHETEERSAIGTSAGSSSATSSTAGPVMRLEWSNDEDEDITKRQDELISSSAAGAQHSAQKDPSAWKDTFYFLERILQFVVDRVLLKRPSLCALVGRRLFGKPKATPSALNLELFGIPSRRLGDDYGFLMEPLIAALEETCIPTKLEPKKVEETLTSAAESLKALIEPFLASMAESGLLLDGGEGSDTRLSKFVSSFEKKYVENRRCIILNTARNILTKNDYHNTVTVGEEVAVDSPDERLGITDGMSVFKLHRCSISDTAHKIMLLCRATMDEAVAQTVVPNGSPLASLPAALYRSAREVLDLYRAIITVSHGYEIKNIPRTAAVLHNDCVYFAHHCLTLGLEYKDKFPEAEPDDARGKLLRQTCFFVDMLPLFRDLADRSLGDMLDLQARQIVEIVEPRIPILGDAMRSEEVVVEWSEAEAALAAATYHLRHIHQAWETILSRDILTRSMWYLSDVLFTLFLDQILTAKHISVNACQFVSTLFQKAAHDTRALIVAASTTTTSSNVSAGKQQTHNKTTAAAAAVIIDTSKSRVWDRFTAVGRLMDMSLSDVQVALSDGVFRSITGPELAHLITATFDDSPKRQSVLHLLQHASS